MRRRLFTAAVGILVLLLLAAPASAASIITLRIADTSHYDTEILSFTFSADGGGGTFNLLRESDQLSRDFQSAVALGTEFSGATIVLNKDSQDLYRIDLAGRVFFSSYVVIDGLEPQDLIGLTADTVTLTEFPATPVPEPASALLLLTGGAVALVRRARSSHAS